MPSLKNNLGAEGSYLPPVEIDPYELILIETFLTILFYIKIIFAEFRKSDKHLIFHKNRFPRGLYNDWGVYNYYRKDLVLSAFLVNVLKRVSGSLCQRKNFINKSKLSISLPV